MKQQTTLENTRTNYNAMMPDAEMATLSDAELYQLAANTRDCIARAEARKAIWIVRDLRMLESRAMDHLVARAEEARLGIKYMPYDLTPVTH